MNLSNIIPWPRRDHIGEELAAAAKLVDEMDAELSVTFPPLTLTQLEMQDIGIKRAGFLAAIEDAEYEIECHEGEIARLRALNAERRSILSGLEQHEKVISFGQPKKATAPESRKGRKPVAIAAE